MYFRVLFHRRRLDGKLLEGAEPASRPELALRARQLTARRHRRLLADGLEEAMRLCEQSGTPRISASVPFVQADVRAARAALLELECSLRGSGEVSPAGVILAERLLTDGNGPLYVKSANDALWHAARDASAALDGSRRRVSDTAR
ncbi:MAG TPA: hypothetical protein VEJ23_10275 [Solirubrobacteraceae bacterium]|nr:hypothetical protein [Solirubrobacteraceae bacterium]